MTNQLMLSTVTAFCGNKSVQLQHNTVQALSCSCEFTLLYRNSSLCLSHR